MEAGGCDFAACVEIGEIGAGEGVCFNSADHVMGAGTDGDQIFADIYIEAFAQFGDEGETFFEMCFIEMANVEVDVGGVCFEHLFQDGAADDVARG